MADKTILILGAGGFTGRHLVRLLQDTPGYRPVNARDHGVDLMRPASVADAARTLNPTAIINLAAIADLGTPDKALIYRMNMLSVIEMAEALIGMGYAGRFIHASSALVYGTNTPDPIREDHPLDPRHHYAVAKAAADQALLLLGDALDIRISRPFNCIGVGHKPQYLLPKLVRHFASRAPDIDLGDTSIARDFVDIRDVARMYLHLVETPDIAPVVNFCSGHATPIARILDELHEISGHEIRVRQNVDNMRPVENPLMSGCNGKLIDTGFHYKYPLADTLRWMLCAERNGQGPLTHKQ